MAAGPPLWTKTSRAVGVLTPAVRFPLIKTLRRWRGERELEPLPVPAPPFARPGEDFLPAARALPHAQALAAHYQSLIDIAVSHGEPYGDFGFLMGLQTLALDAGEKAMVLISIESNLDDLRNIQGWLASPDGEPFIDLDQGWQLDAVQDGDRLCLRQLDDIDGAEIVNVSTAFPRFRTDLETSIADARSVIAVLTAALGADIWTDYVSTATFGTASWKPGAPRTGKAVRDDAPSSWRRALGEPFAGKG